MIQTINRRTLIQTASYLLAATSLKRNTHGADGKPAWKTAVGLNGFESSSRKYKKLYPIWEILEFCSTVGFDGIELVQNWPMGDYPKPSETKRIIALKKMYQCFGLQIFSIQTGAGDAFSPSAEKRNQWLEGFKEQAWFAKQAGCECVGVWPGGPLGDQTIDDAILRLSESLFRAGEVVRQLNMVLSFEIEPPFVFNTEEHLVKILQTTNHPFVKTMYDPSHFDLMNGSNGFPHEMLLRIGVENIGYVHLTDTDGSLRDGGTSKHLPCGDGHAQIDVSLQVLRENGYTGWIMIDAWEIEDVYDACQKGYRMIQAAMNS